MMLHPSVVEGIFFGFFCWRILSRFFSEFLCFLFVFNRICESKWPGSESVLMYGSIGSRLSDSSNFHRELSISSFATDR